MGRGSFHAKVLVLFIKNCRLPLQLIKKNAEKNSRYLQLAIGKKVNQILLFMNKTKYYRN